MKALILFLFLSTVCAKAQLVLGNSAVVFATVEEGKQVLSTRDDFVQRMSPFDRAARLKMDKDVSEQEYLQFVGNSVLAWNDAEKEKLTSAFRGVQAPLDALSKLLPKKVYLIKSTGEEEGNAPYTRATAIILPKGTLEGSVTEIQRSICHELFHILSRANPELREKLYAAIGFLPCDEVSFPEGLRSRKITNPDAPKNDHYIRVTVDGIECCAVPILFSAVPKYDVVKRGEFFNYLQFRFLMVEVDAASGKVQPVVDAQGEKLVGVERLSQLFEQVGRNTGYIIHPEEILADNFALIAMGTRRVPSPDILGKLEKILEAQK